MSVIKLQTLLPGMLLLTLTCYATAGTYVYVSVAGESRISVLEVDPVSGLLTHRRDVTTDGEPGALAVDPKNRFLFASIRSAGALTSFKIDPATGTLSPLSTSVVEADPAYVRVDASGKYLLSAYYRAGKVAVHAIDIEGRISSEAIQWTNTAEKAHAVVIDRSNRFVFVPHTGPNTIFQFRFDATSGTLVPHLPAKTLTPDNTGPRHGWFHPNGRFAYFDNEQGSSVTAFHFDQQTGKLEAFQTISTLPADFSNRNSCADLELTPSGKFLYASNRGHDSIACFALNENTGAMSLMSITPTETTPRSFNIDPSEKFLYAAGQGSGKLAGYRIDSDSGALTRLDTYAIGKKPWWVLVVRTPE